MKKGTLCLKVVVFLIGIPILALCIVWLPGIANNTAQMNPKLAYLQYPVLIGVYATTIPFFLALYQAFRLLNYIDKNKAFSELSIKALKTIKYCAITISILCVIGMPILYILAQEDDAPGIVLLGLILAFASSVIAAFAAVLQKLLKDAIEIKSDNDLTI